MNCNELHKLNNKFLEENYHKFKNDRKKATKFCKENNINSHSLYNFIAQKDFDTNNALILKNIKKKFKDFGITKMKLTAAFLLKYYDNIVWLSQKNKIKIEATETELGIEVIIYKD